MESRERSRPGRSRVEGEARRFVKEKRLTVSLDDDLFERMKAHVTFPLSLSGYVRSLIERDLAGDERAA